MIRKNLLKLLDNLGYSLARKPAYEDEFMALYNACKPFTMTSIQRMFSLYQGVKYVIAGSIPGDFVECGVWRGGSSMLIAKTLLHLGVNDRDLYLYDTFEGMSPPTGNDIDHHGTPAEQLMAQKESLGDKQNSVWCLADLQDVQTNLKATNYPENKIHFIKGKVEDTLPGVIPKKISLLRLDTDWYESTYHELIHLYPLLENAGMLILDDYGHWQGARKATDQYFAEKKIPIYLNTIDFTGRMAIKAR
jgi:O-methyltransferase